MRSVTLLLAWCTITLTPVAAQVGTVHFPVTGSAEAREVFTRGVALLHSFEYDRAAATFREARALDSSLVMAVWGEAMTHTHPVWNEQDLAAARGVLQHLGATREDRLDRAPTPRERAWLAAVETLYGDGSKPLRDTLYARAMEQVVADFPDDDEAHAFHALALLGLSQGVRDVATYMRAGAIANEVFRRNQDHPGAAHYVIHAFDDPVHAPLGLHAANRYIEIAPAAPHAQHMTTHIFLALGMWDRVVSQNEVAAGPDREGWRAGHYTSWLGYGLLQQGRFDEARALLVRVRENARAPWRRGEAPSLQSMRAHHLLTTERWDDPAIGWTLDVTATGPVARAMDRFALGYAALQRGDVSAARTRLTELAALIGEEPADDFYSANRIIPAILTLQLRAALERAGGQWEAALVLLREAAAMEEAMPAEFGPPDVAKPSFELLGEWLLADGKAAEARRAFERALALAPGRSSALRGLMQAADRAGDRAAAGQARERLASHWRRADPGVKARMPGGH